MFDLLEKRAIVTGGAQGIGKAIARKFLENSGSVLIADLPTSVGYQAVQDLRSEFGNHR